MSSTMHRLDERASAPWLTVVMPTHCGEPWLDASLSSLVAEASTGIEVLVIDSSPTSTTLDIARRYSHRLQLRVFERPDLLTWTSKTNFGVRIAGSSHVCWLHQDDLWFPGRASAVRDWIESAPDISLHLAPSAIIDRSGRSLGVWRCPLPTSGELCPTVVTERLLVQNFIAAPAPVFRKAAWLACGGLDDALWYTADWDIWLKLSASSSVQYHDSVTTGFRIHGGSQTMSGRRDIAEFARQMQIVFDRHVALACARSKDVERAGRASIAVNTALASAFAGRFDGLSRAVVEVLRLGLIGMHRYLRDSRIMDRTLPRIRAKLRGVF